MIDSKMPRCILVYNPHSGHGHLDSWNALFISFLLDAGWHVLALTPDATELKNRLAQKKQLHIQHLQILDWNVPLRGLTERVIGKLSRVFRKLLGFNSTSDSIVVSANDPELHYFEPIEFAKRIRIATHSVKYKPEIVFNMYMDMYRTDSERWRLFDQYNLFKWAGIRFVPREYPTEAYYQSPSFAGMCFLDEEVCTQYEKTEPNKSFAYLPDITETALPDHPAELVEHILSIANGRKIVFLGGSIGGNKNLAKWYELINLADPETWFFVQIGEIHQSTLSNEDTVALDDILKNQPENLFIKTEYLQSEALFNAVIVASDILFAVYRNFTISSNMIGKAAAFERPILVAENYLMGERVNRYQLGLAVPENDAQSMLSALHTLITEPIPPENFADYRNDFSLPALQRQFFQFLNRIQSTS